MTQEDRNRLYNYACQLDNLPRVRIPKGSKSPKPLNDKQLEVARIQDKVEELYVLVSEAVLEEIADGIRDRVANDGGAL